MKHAANNGQLRRLCGPLKGRAVLLLVGVCLLIPRSADGLDSQRPLTQALTRIWQVQQGLPRAAIFAIRQTADGYIWLGTQAGLHRFDGVRFTAVTDDRLPALNEQWIQDVQEDRDHNLWLATDNAGLIRLREGVRTTFDKKSGLPSDHVQCLLVDHDGVLWLGTDAGLVKKEDDKFKIFRIADGLASDDIRALTQGPDGSIWIGSEGRTVSVWKGQGFALHTLSSIPATESVQALLGAKDGSMWIGTSDGLVHWQNGQERRFGRRDGLADNGVNCLMQGSEGSIWVGTRDGLSRLQGKEIESFRTRDGLSQSTVYTIWEDHEGSVWVGTKHGLNQLIDRRTIPYTVSEGLPSNDAGPVLQDHQGQVWVGTLQAGLARFDGRHFRVVANLDTGLPSNTVLSLAEGRDHSLWVGTDRGLSLLRDGRIVETFATAQGLPSDVVRCVCCDKSGRIWAGTTAGIAEYRDGKFVLFPDDSGLSRQSVQAVAAYGDQSLVVATESTGLYRITDRRITPLGNDAHISRGVDAFYQDEEGFLWTGVRGSGLGLIQKDKLNAFTTKDGLYDDDIYGISSDNEGHLWMACSRGIFSVERKGLLKFASGEAKKIICNPFSPTDALRTIECQQGVHPAVWKLKDGLLWFSTIRGIIVLDPAKMSRHLPPPPVLVEEVFINGKNDRPSQLSVLPPGRTNMEFHYTALSLVSPTRITFRYMLEGFDKEWIDAGSRREAFYTNLPPGSYRFRVAAANPDGDWNEATQRVTFTLQPHFYQTRWFIPSLIVLSALAGWIVFRLRVQQIKLQLHATLKERSRIARELHDTLIQGFSGVTMQMQGLAARLKLSPERETLDEIIHDAGDCLREARHSVAGLRNPASGESGLAASIAQAARQLTETGDLSLHLRLSRSPVGLPPDAEYNILRIVQEAISNAVRHSAGRKIEVSLNSSPNQLQVSVRDDGIGFDVQQLEPSLPGHYGLIGMRERAVSIRAMLKIESEPGHGTDVCLYLPLGNGAATAMKQQPAVMPLETT